MRKPQKQQPPPKAQPSNIAACIHSNAVLRGRVFSCAEIIPVRPPKQNRGTFLPRDFVCLLAKNYFLIPIIPPAVPPEPLKTGSTTLLPFASIYVSDVLFMGAGPFQSPRYTIFTGACRTISRPPAPCPIKRALRIPSIADPARLAGRSPIWW